MHKVIQTIKQQTKKILGKTREVTKLTSQQSIRNYITLSSHLRVVGISASVMLAIVMTLTVAPIVIHSSIAEAAPGASTPSATSITMTTNYESASLTLTPHDDSGTFTSSGDNEQAKFAITTNNYTGYTLSVSAASDSGLLTNSATSTTLASIEYYTDAETFANGSANIYNGKWGYLPSKYNSADNIYFRPSPTTSASTLDVTSAANSESNDYTIALGARVDYSKPSGTYTSTFTLTAIANKVDYTITYADNSGDSTVASLPAASGGQTNATTITLTSDVPTRDKYKFVSWCLGASGASADDIVTDAGTVCHGTEYASGADFGIDQTTANITTLYAVWAESYEGYLQDFTIATCASMATGETKILRDTRDDQDYNIAKLADGNCWMDNLNLGDTDNYPLVAANLNSSNTNVSSSTAISASTWNGYKKTSSLLTYTAAEYIPISGTDSTSGTAYGTLYNYCATSAGTICTDSNPNNTAYDICPKGWRLPTGGSSGEFQALYNNSSYNSLDKMRASIANGGAAFALAGFFGSKPIYQDIFGDYWSSTRYSNMHMYSLSLNTSTSDVSPASNEYRRAGYSIRCILQNPLDLAGVTTMQDIGKLSASEKSALLESLPEDTSYPISDSRDNQIYYVAKLKDGNLWLQDNLRLGSTSTINLTTENTNIATNWTLPAGITSEFSSWTDAQINVAYKDQTTTSYGSGSGKIGVYYNYCAASAGTYCMAVNSGSGNASYDICPKGWRMPTSGSSGEYKALYTAYSSNVTKLETALSTPLSGFFRSSSTSEQGGSGRFWSSTYSNANYMYYLYVDSLAVGPAYNYDRNSGYSVRCILNTKTISDVSTMQETGLYGGIAKQSILDSMTNGQSYSLTDSRDNQTYTVAKINGNLWMTQNLRFKGTSISPTDTNIDTAKTITYGDLTSGDSYDEARIHDSGNTTTGVWYNYAAASAVTITGNSNSTEASYSICPKGWRLPTYSEQSGITSSASAFSPVTGGFYGAGSLNATGLGYWWSSTAGTATNRRYLYWSGSSLGTSSDDRQRWYYIRCVRS